MKWKYAYVAVLSLSMTCAMLSMSQCTNNSNEVEKPVVTWWLFGDSHVGHRFYNDQLSRAIDDVNELAVSDFAICLGDCIDERGLQPDWHGDHPLVEWENFVRVMDDLNHDRTYILGNHDNDGREPPVNPVAEPNYFTQMVNGVRIIAISDEHLDEDYVTDLEMSQEQRDWFKGILKSDPDIPTIIMSHQDPAGLARENPRSTIPFFHEWLEPRLDEFRIVLWVSAHAHNWYLAENAGGHSFTHLILDSILYEEQSAFMTIDNKGDSPVITLRFRDHGKKEWISVEGHDEYVITW